MTAALTSAERAIESVEQQIGKWHTSRSKKLGPIPQLLWQAAAALCKTQL